MKIKQITDKFNLLSFRDKKAILRQLGKNE
jgi:hypothetical protein